MVVLARTDLLEIPVVFVGLIIVLDTTLFLCTQKYVALVTPVCVEAGG